MANVAALPLCSALLQEVSMASITTAWLDEASRSRAWEMEVATDTGGDREDAVVSKAGVNSCGLWLLSKKQQNIQQKA